MTVITDREAAREAVRNAISEHGPFSPEWMNAQHALDRYIEADAARLAAGFRKIRDGLASAARVVGASAIATCVIFAAWLALR